jgi:hypothetical protein
LRYFLGDFFCRWSLFLVLPLVLNRFVHRHWPPTN